MNDAQNAMLRMVRNEDLGLEIDEAGAEARLLRGDGYCGCRGIDEFARHACEHDPCDCFFGRRWHFLPESAQD